MSKNKYIAAFTETFRDYPAYISINKKDDVYVISMRQRGNTDGIMLEIPKFDLARLCREIQANIGIDVNDITEELNAEINRTNEELEKEQKLKNYAVRCSGHKTVFCDTVTEVWDALGKRQFGSTYEVFSPTGLDTSEFIPF